MATRNECPECGRRNLFRTESSSGGGHAPNYLAGLGSFWRSARFEVVLCQDCGLTRFFASDAARRKVGEAGQWSRIP
jgi:predicted nucleic-acid-binding Zn-ribbon protein